MADGALEGEAFADGTLRAPDLTPAVAAVHAELWRGETAKKRDTMSFLLQKRTALCKLRKMHSLWDSGGSYQTVLFQWQNPFDSLTQSYLYRGASAPQGRAQAEGVAGAWPSEALGRNPRSLQSWRLHLVLFPPQQLRGLAQLGGR